MTSLYEKKIILITGGIGFIGSHLVDVLIQCNPKKIIIFDNLSASNLNNIEHLLSDKRIEFVNGDVRDYEMVEKYILQSDIVFNLAAGNVGHSVLYPRINLETNTLGTFNILQAIIKKPDAMLIHISSGSVVNPSTVYAISKLAGEQLCLFYTKEYGVKLSIVRPYHVFGPRQDAQGRCGVINIFLKHILQGEYPVVWGLGDQIKRFTYVQDLVDAILLVADKGNFNGEIYDVAAETRMSIKNLAYLLIKKYARDKSMQPLFDKPKIGENMVLSPDTTKIKELGWKENYTFEQGLEFSKKWVKEQLK